MTPPTIWQLYVDLNLNLMTKRTVSEDLLHVKNEKINPLHKPVLYEPLNKIK